VLESSPFSFFGRNFLALKAAERNGRGRGCAEKITFVSFRLAWSIRFAFIVQT
jgi:hypothetical protein